MDEGKTDKLVAAVMEQLQSDEDNLNAAVDIAIDFSKQNSVSPEILIELSSTFGSNGTYAPAYVLAKAASNLSEGEMKANACNNAGLASSYMGHNEEAKEQYKIALGIDPNNASAHSNYGDLLKETGRNEEAEEQYKIALDIDPNNANTHSNYGVFLNEIGRNEEAEEQYKIALDIDPNNANIHYNYGILLNETGRDEEAEEQYKIALDIDPNNVNTHSNYGVLLNDIGRNEEAEEQYKIALDIDPNNVNTHYNYGILLNETGRDEEAEEQYKIALDINPKNVKTRSNYGNLLKDIGRDEEAEEQYKIAMDIDPNHVNTHSNYGNLLNKVGRNEEAEEQYKIALDIDPNHVNAHGAYGLFLFAAGKEKKALEETKTASRLFGEKDDNIMEHLALAWLYERYAERYYKKGNAQKEKKERTGGYFRKSGEYAGLAGDEYIEASKHAEDKGKSLYLNWGYTLKGRSEIRRLELSFQDKIKLSMRNLRRDDYDIAKFELIMDGVQNAANYYKKSAKHSPIRDIQCDACSKCMSVLSSILGYMLATIRYKTVPELSVKMKEWDEALSIADMTFKVQEKSEKGRKFVESLRKFASCIENLEKYKSSTMPDDKRALNDCMDELNEVALNIEGPLQEILDDSAKRMDKCKIKHKLYTSDAEKETIGQKTLSKKILGILMWTVKHPIKLAVGLIITIFISVIATVIANDIDTNTVLEWVINATK